MPKVKIPAPAKFEGVETEVEFEQLLEAVRAAIAPAPQADRSTHPLSFNRPRKAANDNGRRGRPFHFRKAGTPAELSGQPKVGASACFTQKQRPGNTSGRG
jgi:hypothetical protein